MEKDSISDYYSQYSERISYYGPKNHCKKISKYSSKNWMREDLGCISNYKSQSKIGFRNKIEYLNAMSAIYVSYGLNPYQYNANYNKPKFLTDIIVRERGTIHDQL